MSDNTSPLRNVDVGALRKHKRPAPQPVEEPAPEPIVKDAPPAKKPAPRKRSPKKATPQPDVSTGEQKKMQVNALIPMGLRNRSRAAFAGTRHVEGYRSYSDFIAKAIEREVARVESEHNDGHPYSGGDDNLTAGRPLSE